MTEDQLGWLIICLALGWAVLYEVTRFCHDRRRLVQYQQIRQQDREKIKYRQCMIRTAQLEVGIYGAVVSWSVDQWLRDNSIEIAPPGSSVINSPKVSSFRTLDSKALRQAKALYDQQKKEWEKEKREFERLEAKAKKIENRLKEVKRRDSAT